MEDEIWMPIFGFETHYEISNLGNVRSFTRNKLSSYGSYSKLNGQKIKPVIQKKTGYAMITIRNGTITQQKLLHRLVGLHFIPNHENKPCINHINGIKTDNRAENLEWCTHKENNAHAMKNGLTLNKLIPFVGRNIKEGNEVFFDNIQDAANFVKGDRGNIHKCLRKKNNRVTAYGYVWEYTHISHNLISSIQSPLSHITI